jgi:hypothetical protein
LSWLFSYHQKDISFEIEQFNSDIKPGGFLAEYLLMFSTYKNV